MEDPLKIYNDVLKITGESVANEVPFSKDMDNNEIVRLWVCPWCKATWYDAPTTAIIHHLKSHGYSDGVSQVILEETKNKYEN